MPIPPLDQHGLLPVGVHDCTLDEIKARFGSFQRSDRRPRLFAKLETFVLEAASSGLVVCVVVDGSFVMAESEPNDVDLIVVVSSRHDFEGDIDPKTYNVLSKHRVFRRFGFDILVAREGSEEFDRWVAFFQQVRLEHGRQKGILRVRL